MIQAVNDDMIPAGLTQDQLNDWLKRAHWTPEMLAQATYASPRQVKRQITDGKIKGVTLPSGEQIVPIAEVRRILGLE